MRADPHLKDQVRLLSVSFDPGYDTPAVLAAYASHFRAPGFDWRFLTAGSDAALAATLDGYGQWIIRDYDADGNYLGTVSHLLRVFLIDRQRHIRNIHSTTFLHADTVANDIRTLLLEQPSCTAPQCTIGPGRYGPGSAKLVARCSISARTRAVR